jgi:RHS repeat-associated protein
MSCKYSHFIGSPNEGDWYGTTILSYKPGYFARSPGVCVKRDEAPAPPPGGCDGGGPGGGPGASVGNPVQVASGAKVQTETDLLAGLGNALQVNRTYRSLHKNWKGQSAGVGWSFSFDRDFTIDRGIYNSSVPTVMGSFGDGSVFAFNPRSDGTFVSRYDKRVSLKALNSAYDDWLLTTSDGRVERYKKTGDAFKIISSHSADGDAVTYSYDTENRLVLIADSTGRTVRIGWHGVEVDSIDGPNGGVRYEYEQAPVPGQAAITGMARLEVVHFHDGDGKLGASKRYHYENEWNRYLLTGITDENGARFATYAYDAFGSTVLSEHAGGVGRYTFDYSSESARRITDPLGTERSMNVSYLFGDTRGRITAESQPGGAGCTAGANARTYAADGDLASSTDFNGQKTCFVTDSARGLETRRIAGLAASANCPVGVSDISSKTARMTSTQWHPDWPIKSALAEANRITTYIFNGERGADGQVAHCAPDSLLPNGKPIAAMCSVSVQATTDINGTLGFAATKTGAARVWQYTYNGEGRLLTRAGPADANGNVDAMRLTYYADTTDTYGSTGSSVGHVTSVTYPSGNRIDIVYGDDGRASSLAVTAPGATPVPILGDIRYLPFGVARGWTWGNSTAASPNIYQRGFDLDGRIVSYPLGHPDNNGTVRTLSYDAAGRITASRHTGGPTAAQLDQRYDYDNLDRLTGFDGASTSQRFQYDANGNRTQATFGANTYSNTINAGSNRLTSTTGPAPAKQNLYDAAGDLTKDGTIQYSYGSNGRLSGVVSGGIATGYRYNGMGQRVVKTGAAAVAVHYVYDEAGRLLGEYDGAGNAIQETVYLGDLPVAVLKPGAAAGTDQIAASSLHYVYADHLSTPRVLTRASDNRMVWRWDNTDPFGLGQPDQNPSRLGELTYNPRFPGQVFDRETNNHYNYFRDYDPQAGRYTQSDPIA